MEMNKRQQLAEEIFAELDRAISLWPDSVKLPDGTGGGGRKTWEAIAKASCDRAHREGRLTHTHVFDEETAEVMAAETPEELRQELVQVGAMVVKWLLDLDSRRALDTVVIKKPQSGRAGHYRDECQCGAVVVQCRCPGEKLVKVVRSICPACMNR